MREFFKGWRRKVGCVMLVMACLLMGTWVRSRIVADTVSIKGGNLTTLRVCSCRTGIVLVYLAEAGSGDASIYPRFDWSSVRYQGEIPPPTKSIADDGVWGFGYFGKSNDYQSAQLVVIPFLPVAAPLALLSAYLILWRPRTKKDKPHA